LNGIQSNTYGRQANSLRIQNGREKVILNVQENGQLQQEETHKGKEGIMLLIKDEANQMKEKLNIMDEELDWNINPQTKTYEGIFINQGNQINLQP
jgi:hypothetical protein